MSDANIKPIDKSQVTITGVIDGVYMAKQQLIVSDSLVYYFPLKQYFSGKLNYATDLRVVSTVLLVNKYIHSIKRTYHPYHVHSEYRSNDFKLKNILFYPKPADEIKSGNQKLGNSITSQFLLN